MSASFPEVGRTRSRYGVGRDDCVSAPGPVRVFGLNDVVGKVRAAASATQYRDNPVLVTMKVLDAAGMLTETMPDK